MSWYFQPELNLNLFSFVHLLWWYSHKCVLLRVLVKSAEITTVICDKANKAQVLLDNVERRDTPGLRRLILMDAFDLTLVEHGKRCGVHVQALQEVEVCEIRLLSGWNLIYISKYVDRKDVPCSCDTRAPQRHLVTL